MPAPSRGPGGGGGYSPPRGSPHPLVSHPSPPLLSPLPAPCPHPTLPRRYTPEPAYDHLSTLRRSPAVWIGTEKRGWEKGNTHDFTTAPGDYDASPLAPILAWVLRGAHAHRGVSRSRFAIPTRFRGSVWLPGSPLCVTSAPEPVFNCFIIHRSGHVPSTGPVLPVLWSGSRGAGRDPERCKTVAESTGGTVTMHPQCVTGHAASCERTFPFWGVDQLLLPIPPGGQKGVSSS